MATDLYSSWGILEVWSPELPTRRTALCLHINCHINWFPKFWAGEPYCPATHAASRAPCVGRSAGRAVGSPPPPPVVGGGDGDEAAGPAVAVHHIVGQGARAHIQRVHVELLAHGHFHVAIAHLLSQSIRGVRRA
jgi:hypothetical protein